LDVLWGGEEQEKGRGEKIRGKGAGDGFFGGGYGFWIGKAGDQPEEQPSGQLLRPYMGRRKRGEGESGRIRHGKKTVFEGEGRGEGDKRR